MPASRALINGWPLVAGLLSSTAAPSIPLTITGANATVTIGDTASFTPSIAGGKPPYSVTATNLEPGRSIVDAATGLTTGAYTTAGGYSITYTATDSAGATASFTRVVTVNAAGATLPDVSPTLDWRLPITQATSADSTFNSALVASNNTNKTWPSRSLAIATHVIPIKVDAVAAPGALLNYLITTNNGSFTITAEESYDSTNGTDGTWATIASPTYKAAGLTATNKGQMIRLASGAARWVRLTIVMSGATGVLFLKAHQRPATGRAFIYGQVGASKESLGLLTRDLWLELTKQYPGADPVILDYSNGGVTAPTIKSNLDLLLSEIPEVRYVYTGQVGGNDVTANRPYSTASQSSKNDLTTNYNAVIAAINNAPSVYGGFVTLDYRNYNSAPLVNGTLNQENGSKPYNENLFIPLIQAGAPDQYDTSRGVPFLHPYSCAVQKPWLISDDGSHETTVGFAVLRREIVRSWFARLLSGSYPAKPFETLLVERAEATGSYVDKTAASNAVAALPGTSSVKTALTNRLAAIPAPKTDVIQIAFTSKPTLATPNWNRVPTANVSGSALSSLVDVTGATVAGASLAVTSGSTTVALTGGNPTGYDDGTLPDEVLDGYVSFSSAGSTWSMDVTVPGASYRVETMSTIAGQYTTRSSLVTVNGTSKTRNPSDNMVLDVFDAVTPVGGKITISFTPASGSTRAYLNAVRITRLT
jgi:hypothetical protein